MTENITQINQPTPPPPLDYPLNPPAQQAQKREFTIPDAVISVICFALGWIFTHFVCGYPGGLWGGIMWLLFGITGAVFVKIKQIPVTVTQKIIFGIAAIFCFTPLFCANILINLLASLFTALLYLYLGITLSGIEPFGEHFISDLFRSVMLQPFSCYGDAPKAAGKLLKNKKAGKNVGLAIAGIIITLPVTLFVMVLLAISDDGFSDLMENIFIRNMPDFEFRYIVEFGFAFIVWMYLFGALSASVESAAPRYADSRRLRFVPSALGYPAVTPICIFYVIYIAMQFRYFTAAFTGVLPEGFSYSGYARQGFFELCTVAVINLVVIAVLQTFMKRGENDEKTAPLRIYTTAISVFTLFLIASAISKMVLYIKEMGMTPLRVYTSWFMLLLAIVFVLIIASQFTNIKFWKTAFAAFAVMMGILCFGNIDGMIADYNVTAYETGRLETVDFEVLEELGRPAVRHIERLLDSPDRETYQRARTTLVRIEDYSEEYSGFAYFSFPSM